MLLANLARSFDAGLPHCPVPPPAPIIWCHNRGLCRTVLNLTTIIYPTVTWLTILRVVSPQSVNHRTSVNLALSWSHKGEPVL